MPSLELKIPPPVVALLIAVAMWGIAFLAPVVEVPTLFRVCIAVAIALAGAAFSFSGIMSFRRAHTTVNPMKPQAASSLVSSGIYRVTRNPMYVGLLFVLVAWAAFLSTAWSLLGPLAFFLYIGRFQITPEERVLLELFGAEYSGYKAKVRRWL
jgi:protein-S-isoprenylcysteine O-methyltransferase Ste14